MRLALPDAKSPSLRYARWDLLQTWKDRLCVGNREQIDFQQANISPEMAKTYMIILNQYSCQRLGEWMAAKTACAVCWLAGSKNAVNVQKKKKYLSFLG